MQYLDEEQLHKHLCEIRTISKMDDDKAICKLDEFIYEIRSALSSCDVDIEGIAKILKDPIKEYTAKLNTRDIYLHTASALRDEIITFNNFFDEKDTVTYGNVLISLVEEVHSLANRIEIEAYIMAIINFDNDKLQNVISVRATLKLLAEAEACLNQSNALTLELTERIMLIKESCAWFRARRKRTENEQISLNDRKRLKLLGEMQELLNQDWIKIFPATPVPRVV